MTFVSYAQNYEDVILRRALSDVENGFYIDVGANDPVIDSVTKAFYDAGWRGINIEPVNEWYENLRRDRPEDTNLPFAVGCDEREIDFYEVVGTGLSTVHRVTAEKHANERGYQIKSYKVQLKTLSTILKAYPKPVIHFLKIDVEGAERTVLEGLDLKENRPWIILIESTLPNSTIENHDEWEFILFAADYEFVYFDGLNRFYVAIEHQEIKSKLAIPPNVFDNFELSGFSSSSPHSQIASIKSQLALDYQQHTDRLNELVKNKDAQIEFIQAELDLRDVKLKERDAQIEFIQAELDRRDETLKKQDAQIEFIQAELDRRDETLKAQLLSLANKEAQLKDADQLLKDHKRQLVQLDQTHLHWKREAGRLKTELGNVYNSKSWRVTLPLRILWKPFESKPALAAAKSAKHTSSAAIAVETLTKRDSQRKAYGEDDYLSADEILKRIRTELENNRRENTG